MIHEVQFEWQINVFEGLSDAQCYHVRNHWIFCCEGRKVKSRNITFTLQSNLPGSSHVVDWPIHRPALCCSWSWARFNVFAGRPCVNRAASFKWGGAFFPSTGLKLVCLVFRVGTTQLQWIICCVRPACSLLRCSSVNRRPDIPTFLNVSDVILPVPRGRASSQVTDQTKHTSTQSSTSLFSFTAEPSSPRLLKEGWAREPLSLRMFF